MPHDRSFDDMQASLADLLGPGSASDLESGTLVVLPSLTFPEAELRKIIGIQYYEERLLFLLLMLKRSDVRIVYVTSLRVEEQIVDYYLRFTPDEAKAGDRLYLVALWDQRPIALSSKLLESPEALERLSALGGDDACMLAFNVTDLERRISELTQIPLYGCHPDLVSLGSKSGARQLAQAAGVSVLSGAEDLHSLSEIEAAIADIRTASPAASAVVIKLNDGFSGQGNAVIQLDDVTSPLDRSPTSFCATEESWPSFKEKIAAGGAIVEELLRARGLVSPSVQMRVAPDRSFEIISTHDQILGGPDDQVYLGCRFPADSRYRLAIQDEGVKIARILADKGVMGSFAVDFLIGPGAPDNDGEAKQQIYLSEINLRLGGTTHPFLMAEFATGGTYDPATGDLMANGAPKFYIATDNLKSDAYIGLLPEQVIAALDEAGLGFDPMTATGTALHLLGALKRFGKIGMTCIADSPEEAEKLYDMTLEVIDALLPIP
ncbi:MAG: peptide ligase PGM1-related protein [Actinomycetota bacterium]